ncbi:MAG: sigma-70 family RNA polymerase sigma factor [Archangiaceae bacterium]|nr:sigma-70 family RNA polymerase sigma factor [Archangiaceae bacterium]
MENASLGQSMERDDAAARDFAQLYDAHVDFVWRSLRGLGVAEAHAADATQDVFIVVHRHLARFEGRASLRGWLFGIARKVAHDYRRRAQRKEQHEVLSELLVDGQKTPHEAALEAEALRTLTRLIEGLEVEKREVLVMVDVEQFSVPEVAEVLGINVNTAYSRLRAARQHLEAALARERAADERGQP